MENINDKVEFFNASVHEALQCLPHEYVEMTDKDKSWISPLLKSLINKRWQSYRLRNWPMFNHFKNKVREEIRKCKESWATKCSENAKSMWNAVKDVTGKRNRYPLSRIISNFNSVYDAACTINDNFASVFSNCDQQSLQNLINTIEDDDWYPYINVEWTFQQLNHINTGKATGCDGISGRLYRAAGLELSNPITHLINTAIEQRTVPDLWKVADVCALPKTSPPNINELRPISLLCLPSKLMEKAILHHDTTVLQSFVDTRQYAYKKKSSTVCAMIDFHNSVTHTLDNNNKGVVVISFDMSKAFDSICHYKLLVKLHNLALDIMPAGVVLKTGFLRLLSSYLFNRHQKVRIGSVCSLFRAVTSGVPQGSCLGPFLFNIFLSDLTDIPGHPYVNMVKYADDLECDLPLTGVNESDVLRIRNVINFMSNYCNENGLKLNESKTKIMPIFCKPSVDRDVYLVDDFPGLIVKDLCYLGVYFQNNLSWDIHVSHIVKRASSRLYALRLLKAAGLSTKNLLVIYTSLIRQLMEYACQVFNGGLTVSQTTKIDQVQRRAHNIICNTNCKCDIFDDLLSRRLQLCKNLFMNSLSSEHPLFHIAPNHLPSGRFAMPFCKTKTRLNSFYSSCILLYNADFTRK
jgi:hypothetical protein